MIVVDRPSIDLLTVIVTVIVVFRIFGSDDRVDEFAGVLLKSFGPNHIGGSLFGIDGD
jgi:hypothetical protein